MWKLHALVGPSRPRGAILGGQVSFYYLGYGPYSWSCNQLTRHADFQICRSIPKFPEFWHSESTPVNFARSHFGANAGLAVLELVVDTRLVGRLRGLPSRSHPITGAVVISPPRSEALWLQRPSLTGGGLVLRSR